MLANVKPDTGGGLGVYRNVNLLNVGQNAKTTAGQLYGWHLYNAGAAVVFVKVYDKATAPASTDTPLITFAIPAGGTLNEQLPAGISFLNGIGVRACTGLADSDNTAPAANQVAVNLFYF